MFEPYLVAGSEPSHRRIVQEMLLPSGVLEYAGQGGVNFAADRVDHRSILFLQKFLRVCIVAPWWVTLWHTLLYISTYIYIHTYV